MSGSRSGLDHVGKEGYAAGTASSFEVSLDTSTSFFHCMNWSLLESIRIGMPHVDVQTF